MKKEYKTKTSLFELKKNKTDYNSVKISVSKDCETEIRKFFLDDIGIYESFFILMMNRANNTIGHAKISQGGVVGTVVDVRIIAKYAVDSLCSSIILAHNHPSGNLKPSEADIRITKNIKEALKLFDIVVLDHLILTEDGYYSFADEGGL